MCDVGLGQADTPVVSAQGVRSVPDRVLPADAQGVRSVPDRSLQPPGFLSRLTSVKAWRGNLPHWEKPGVAVFVTLRLGDSLPMDKLGPFQEDRRVWLEQHPQPWNEVCAREYAERFQGAVEKWLDAGYGSCIFGKADARQVVETALRHYDGSRYSLYAFVVMPNHLHALLMPFKGQELRKIMADFKRFVSRKLATRQTWQGAFWQGEYWDTAIRDEEHFRRVRGYIRKNNPLIAYDAYGEGRGTLGLGQAEPPEEVCSAGLGQAGTPEEMCSVGLSQAAHDRLLV